jgi:hypothetical protein
VFLNLPGDSDSGGKPLPRILSLSRGRTLTVVSTYPGATLACRRERLSAARAVTPVFSIVTTLSVDPQPARRYARLIPLRMVPIGRVGIVLMTLGYVGRALYCIT